MFTQVICPLTCSDGSHMNPDPRHKGKGTFCYSQSRGVTDFSTDPLNLSIEVVSIYNVLDFA